MNGRKTAETIKIIAKCKEKAKITAKITTNKTVQKDRIGTLSEIKAAILAKTTVATSPEGKTRTTDVTANPITITVTKARETSSKNPTSSKGKITSNSNRIRTKPIAKDSRTSNSNAGKGPPAKTAMPPTASTITARKSHSVATIITTVGQITEAATTVEARHDR